MLIDRFCLEQDGQLYLETVTRTPVNENFYRIALADELRNASRVSPKIMNLPFGELRLLLPADSRATVQYAIIPLDQLNFITQWDVKITSTGVNILCPLPAQQQGTSGPPVNPATVDKNLLWAIPGSLPTFLVVNIQGGALSIISYLNGERKLLPLPNMWPDTRLCWKNSDPPPRNAPIIDKVMRAYEGWTSSVWNGDLYKPEFEQVFQWNLDGSQRDLPVADFLIKPSDTPPELAAVYAIIEKERLHVPE
jgi:hypothetical protein